MQHAQRDKGARHSADFLMQFPQCCRGWIRAFSRLQFAGGQFRHGHPHGIAILSHGNDLHPFIQRQNHHAAGMFHYFALGCFPIGQPYFIHMNIHDAAVIHRVAAQFGFG